MHTLTQSEFTSDKIRTEHSDPQCEDHRVTVVDTHCQR